MTAMTLDHLSKGRVMFGFGVSGPQVVEGWYGQPYPRPLARTREWISLFREMLAREGPVDFEGNHYRLPYAPPEGASGLGPILEGTGLGKPLKLMMPPARSHIPLYLGAEGPKNVGLAAELCDGWIPMFISTAMTLPPKGGLPRERKSRRRPKTPPQDFPKTPPDAPKTLPRSLQERPRRFQDGPRRPLDAPKTPQDAPKTPPRRPKTPSRRPKKPPRRPKTPQEAPKTPPRRLQDGPRRPQDASKTPPRRPKTPQDGSIMPKNVKECPRTL